MNKDEIYLDNAATTRALDSVADKVKEVMIKDYGNPSSLHKKGLEAEMIVKEAREEIASVLSCSPKEIIFTSGGTESNNMAIIGGSMALKRKGKHIITTNVEHASVRNTMAFLEEMGYEITYVPVNRDGVVSTEDIKKAIRDDTVLISVMMVNNEIGSVMPVSEIGEMINEVNELQVHKNNKILFHADCIQAFGKYRINPEKSHIDMLSVSGHKIHGPKGVGFIYIKDKTKIKPIIYGGGQQNGMRSGTDNVPGIAGLGLAAKEIYTDFETKKDHMYELKDYMIDRLSEMDNVTVNSKKGREYAPHIINASFNGIRSEVLLHALEEKNIYVSSGSACSSNAKGKNDKAKISETLKGIGLNQGQGESAVRFSISSFTTRDEIDYTIEVLSEMIGMLRMFVRK